MDIKNIIIIKRDGREEKFSDKKLKGLAMWACKKNENMASALLDATKVKLRSRTKSETLLRHMTETASHMISLINPDFEFAAAKLLLLSYYHARHQNTKFDKNKYPHIRSVFNSSLCNNFLYQYTDDEIEDANDYIDQTRDYKFTYTGVSYIMNKYAKWNELPQHVYMRMALALNVNEDKNTRLQRVKTLYDILSKHYITLATPVSLNSGMKHQQLSSCVLIKSNDSTEDINNAINNAVQYSRHHGGISVDVTAWRARNSNIVGNRGKSSGPVAFIRMIEQAITAFSQGGIRSGACNITFDWWHKDSLDMIALKRNDGVEEQRARHLQYSIRLNQFLFDAVRHDEEVHLFDPAKVPGLADTWGDEWVRLYKNAVANKVPSTKVKATELMYEIMKTRTFGNLYVFFTDNVNSQNKITDRFINASNLCTEIMQPSIGATDFKEEFNVNLDGNMTISSTRTPEEVSLCTLGSINLEHFSSASSAEQKQIVDCIVRTLDNTFDIAFYPVETARAQALAYRFIGVGVYNYAYMLAKNEMTFDNPRALKMVDSVFKNMSSLIQDATRELGKERGVYPAWNHSHGEPRRNALTRAIAPTASSGRVVASTESSEPILDYTTELEGTSTLPWIAPEFKRYNKWYSKAFEIDPYVLIDHAAVRQKHIDQSQSVNIYLHGDMKTSAKKLVDLHEYALKKGIKSLYYVVSRKTDALEICESCA